MKSRVAVFLSLFVVLAISIQAASAQEGPGMKFIADVTIPDDARVEPGAEFVKTWTLKNTGGVDWLDYSLQFVSGDEMNGEPDNVAPVKTNGIADLSVIFTAPEQNGTYESWWALVDENGTRVGSQFYVRIIVGAGQDAEPEKAQTIEEFMASVGTVYNMNETFPLNGIEFRVYDAYRNEGIWGFFCGPCVVTDGVWAIARFNVTNHTGYSAMIVDHVSVYMIDNELNEYKRSYEAGRIPRKALVSAPALFGDEVGTVWSTMGTGYVDAAMIHVEPVPADTDLLWVVFEDLETEDYAFVHLQRLVSKSEMRYEGEFINAPPRE